MSRGLGDVYKRQVHERRFSDIINTIRNHNFFQISLHIKCISCDTFCTVFDRDYCIRRYFSFIFVVNFSCIYISVSLRVIPCSISWIYITFKCKTTDCLDRIRNFDIAQILTSCKRPLLDLCYAVWNRNCRKIFILGKSRFSYFLNLASPHNLRQST